MKDDRMTIDDHNRPPVGCSQRAAPAAECPDLTCYVYEGWEPGIRPAGVRRDWMDATQDRFAYRCLPLAIANGYGWEVPCRAGFSAVWDGGPGADSVHITADDGADPRHVAVSLFGAGTITFHVEGIIRTSPGWNLWIGGPPNAAKDGLAPLAGVIETDWSPYSFTMNWRFTRANHSVRFEADEPFCTLFPVPRLIADVIPRIAPIEAEPGLRHAFETWSRSRDALQDRVKNGPPLPPSEQWQKLYYRGLGPDGEPWTDVHESKLRTRPFVADDQARRCPVGSHPSSSPPVSTDDKAPRS